MTTQHSLTAQPRKVTGRAVKKLRTQDLLPGNLFGAGIKSVTLQVPLKDFIKTYHVAGNSTLVYLDLSPEKSPRPIMISDIAKNPVTGQFLHVSFHQVDLKQKIITSVALKLTGESPAVTDKLGILVLQEDQIEIEALPTDMPEHLDLDVTSLVVVGDTLYAKNLKLKNTLTLKSDPETPLVKIEPLAKEEVVAPPVPVEGEVPATAEGVVTDQAQPSSDQSPKPAQH